MRLVRCLRPRETERPQQLAFGLEHSMVWKDVLRWRHSRSPQKHVAGHARFSHAQRFSDGRRDTEMASVPL